MCYDYDDDYDCSYFGVGSWVGLIIGIVIFKIFVISCIIYIRRRRAVGYVIAPNAPVTVVQTTAQTQIAPQVIPCQMPMTNPQTATRYPQAYPQHIQPPPKYPEPVATEMPPAYSEASNPVTLPRGSV